MMRTKVCDPSSRGAPLRKLGVALLAGFLIQAAGGGALAAPQDIALPGDVAHPESITATADGTLYVSNFAGGGVTRIKPGAASGEVWIAPGAFETRATFGVLADAASGTLWVCSSTVLCRPGSDQKP